MRSVATSTLRRLNTLRRAFLLISVDDPSQFLHCRKLMDGGSHLLHKTVEEAGQLPLLHLMSTLVGTSLRWTLRVDSGAVMLLAVRRLRRPPKQQLLRLQLELGAAVAHDDTVHVHDGTQQQVDGDYQDVTVAVVEEAGVADNAPSPRQIKDSLLLLLRQWPQLLRQELKGNHNDGEQDVVLVGNDTVVVASSHHQLQRQPNACDGVAEAVLPQELSTDDDGGGGGHLRPRMMLENRESISSSCCYHNSVVLVSSLTTSVVSCDKLQMLSAELSRTRLIQRGKLDIDPKRDI